MRAANWTVVGAAVGAVALAVAGAQAQPDRWLDTPTGWAYLYAATPSQISGLTGQGVRPFSLERMASADQYDALFVGNSGPYQVSGAQTTYGVTPAVLGSWLSANGLRLLDLEVYEDSGGATRVSAAAVPNSGSTAAPGWGWLYNVTAAQVNSWISGSNLRLIDLDVYTIGGNRVYSAVAVPNTGAGAMGWWYYYNVTGAEVVSYLTQHGARLVSLSLESGGTVVTPARFTVVMVDANPGAGWFYASLTGPQVGEMLSRNGARLTCLRRYTDGLGATKFAAAMVDNANAQTRRMRDYLWSQTDGITGFQLKQVGGPVLASLNEGFSYEPCSTLKLFHGVYAIQRCAQGLDSLTSAVQYRNECSGCAFTWSCTPTSDTLGNTIRRMLVPSDNYALIALEKRYVVTTLVNWASAIGSPGMSIPRQDCQCAVVLNTATCTDFINLMEKSANGTLFSGAWFDELLSRMPGLETLGWGSYPTLSMVIAQEAAAIGLPGSVRDQFRALVRYGHKSGSYECGARAWGTEAGWASIPERFPLLGQWGTVHREYVFSLFGHEASSLPTVVYSGKEEILREQVREALLTWKTACTPSITTHPQPVSATTGQTVQFSVAASASETRLYQWRRNGVNVSNGGGVSGATSATLTITGATPAHAGTYTCVVATVCGSVTSAGATLAVNPPACYPDCNGDGALNLADFGCFQTKFALADPYADCNGDGNLNLADFGCFQTKFALGCP